MKAFLIVVTLLCVLNIAMMGYSYMGKSSDTQIAVPPVPAFSPPAGAPVTGAVPPGPAGEPVPVPEENLMPKAEPFDPSKAVWTSDEHTKNSSVDTFKSPSGENCKRIASASTLRQIEQGCDDANTYLHSGGCAITGSVPSPDRTSLTAEDISSSYPDIKDGKLVWLCRASHDDRYIRAFVICCSR